MRFGYSVVVHAWRRTSETTASHAAEIYKVDSHMAQLFGDSVGVAMHSQMAHNAQDAPLGVDSWYILESFPDAEAAVPSHSAFP